MLLGLRDVHRWIQVSCPKQFVHEPLGPSEAGDEATLETITTLAQQQTVHWVCQGDHSQI